MQPKNITIFPIFKFILFFLKFIKIAAIDVGIKKIRYSLIAGLFADLIGIIASIVIVNIMF